MRLSLHPVSDTGAEIRFAHASGASLVVALVLAAIAAATWIFAEGTARIMVAAPAGFLAATQLLRAAYRYELTLDLRARAWRRRRGFVFAVTSAGGALSDLEAVVLTQTWVDEGTGDDRRSVPMWRVALEFRGPAWGEPLTVGMAGEEPAAYALLEDYARRLRVDAVDRTGGVEIRRAWDALDRPVTVADDPGPAGVGAATAAPPTAGTAVPPAGSGIRVATEGGRRVVTLPPRGFDVVTVVAALFGLAFAAFGAWALVAGSGVLGPLTFNGERTAGPVYLLLALGGAFCFSGLSFAVSGLNRSRLREWVRDEGEMLVFGTSRPGKLVSMDALPKRTIEEVTVHTPRTDGGAELRVMGFPVRGAGGGACVRVRTDDGTVRLGGRLTDDGRAWLRDAVLAMAQDPHTR